VRNVRTEVILHLQFALFLQDEDGQRGKLFGDRADAKLRINRRGTVLLPIGHAIALAEKDRVPYRDLHHATECLVGNLLIEVIVRFFGKGCGW
jgi:hypothetical protein